MGGSVQVFFNSNNNLESKPTCRKSTKINAEVWSLNFKRKIRMTGKINASKIHFIIVNLQILAVQTSCSQQKSKNRHMRSTILIKIVNSLKSKPTKSHEWSQRTYIIENISMGTRHAQLFDCMTFSMSWIVKRGFLSRNFPISWVVSTQVFSAHFSKTRFAGLHSESEEDGFGWIWMVRIYECSWHKVGKTN